MSMNAADTPWQYPTNFFERSYASQRTDSAQLDKIFENPSFGKYFTDHMVQITYTPDQGWHDGRVVPYGPISLSPAAGVLHYAQEIFEGLKVYKHADGTIASFRPAANAARFQSSARRLVMPELPTELFIRSIEELMAVDHGFVPPTDNDASLYLRPALIGSGSVLGLKPAPEYTYLLFGSPSAPYFSGGATQPVSVWVSEDYVRASPGGTGAAKCGGNYAASLIAQVEAADKGCDQVVWLDAVERKYVEEMGGMNLFFVYGDTLVTPELSGSLLAGITRDSVITLARSKGYEVIERKVPLEQVRRDAQSGALTEVFACGTAAVLSPVGLFKTTVDSFEINHHIVGPITQEFHEQIIGIQRGRIPDNHNWVYPISV